MNKGKTVCDRTAIRKERLEDVVLDLVHQSLPTSQSASRSEEMIQEYLGRGDRRDLVEESLQKRLQEIDRKMQNLLDAVEKGIGLVDPPLRSVFLSSGFVGKKL